MGIRLLVTGGRWYSDYSRVERTLATIKKHFDIEVLIHGDARGADRLANMWAERNGIKLRRCPADWDKYGLKAGRIRNNQMLRDEKPDLVIAFQGGAGTAHMKKIARQKKVPVIDDALGYQHVVDSLKALIEEKKFELSSDA